MPRLHSTAAVDWATVEEQMTVQRIMELAASSGRTAVALELDRNQHHQQHRKGSMRTCWWKRMPKVTMVKKAFDPEQ
jgi:hypothetical protein